MTQPLTNPPSQRAETQTPVPSREEMMAAWWIRGWLNARAPNYCTEQAACETLPLAIARHTRANGKTAQELAARVRELEQILREREEGLTAAYMAGYHEMVTQERAIARARAMRDLCETVDAERDCYTRPNVIAAIERWRETENDNLRHGAEPLPPAPGSALGKEHDGL